MNKQNTKKNVYELTQERLRMIFNEFDNIYVSFSRGGQRHLAGTVY